MPTHGSLNGTRAVVADLFGASRLFGIGLRKMIRTDEPLRERLKSAFGEALFTLSVNGSGPPMSADLEARVVVLVERMAERPAYASEGTLSASIDLMSDAELDAAVEEFVGIVEAIEGELAIYQHVRELDHPPTG